MLQRLLRRLPQFLETPPADVEAERRVALAVLLLECARADFDRDAAELAQVRAELAEHFDLSHAQVDALLRESLARADQSTSLYDFVATLNAALGAEDKRAIMALLWRIAYADGRLDPHEEHLLRRLADLLHVPHSDYIATKLAAAGEE